MKYFSLAAAVIGSISATAEQDIYLERNPTRLAELKNDDPTCYGEQELTNFLNSQRSSAKKDDYLVRTKTINNGGSRFMTISCRFPTWQDNGNIYDPYGDGRKWNRTRGSELHQYQADRAAAKGWIGNQDAENWPAGVGGRYRCGNYGGTRRWHVIRKLPWDCPNHDLKGDWARFVRINRIQATLENPAFSNGGRIPEIAIDGVTWDYPTQGMGVAAGSGPDSDFTVDLKDSCYVSEIYITPSRDFPQKYHGLKAFIDDEECEAVAEFTQAYVWARRMNGGHLMYKCQNKNKGKKAKVTSSSQWPVEIAEIRVFC